VAGREVIEAAIRRAVQRFLGLAAAGLLLIAALGFLVAATYLALARVMEPVFACLLTGGALLVLVILVLAATSHVAARTPPPAPKRQGEPALLAALAGEQFATTIESWLGGHRRETVAGLFVLGFAIGWSPRLRRALVRWLRG
jgi:hypothetical protein